MVGLAIGWRIMWTGRFLGNATGGHRFQYGNVNPARDTSASVAWRS